MRCSAWMVVMGYAVLLAAAPATDEGGDGMATTGARELLPFAPLSDFRMLSASMDIAEMGIDDGGRGGRVGIVGSDGVLTFHDRVGIDDDDGVSIDSDDSVDHDEGELQNPDGYGVVVQMAEV
ncbi:hypothetical protein M885DRAFT_575229 [Pelagophyceae sp. CCMP2097]|nr:hypothetical protein M885DRAFT_575229 [Pelagophyceae sp. CCMP2097]